MTTSSEPAGQRGRLPRRGLGLRAGLASGIALLLVGGLAVFGPEPVFALFGGPADQGPVAVATLRRRAIPNDALACSPDLCSAPADLSLPLFAETPESVIARLDAIVLSDRRNLRRVDDGTRPAYRRYVALTPVLRFPDTIDAEALPAPGGGARLGLYGRSKFGSGDFGVNRARLAAWAARLGSKAGAAP